MTEVATLEQLTAAIEAGDSIKLTADITASETINIDKSITLDLNGHKLSTEDYTAINIATESEGTLTLTDSSEDHTGSIEVSNGNTAVNIESGSFTMENVAISVSGSNGTGIYNAGDGTVAITDSKINVRGDDSKGIQNTSGSFTITNVEITATGGANSGSTGIENNGTIDISGGSIETTGNDGVGINNTGTATKISNIGISLNGDGSTGINNTDEGTISELTNVSFVGAGDDVTPIKGHDSESEYNFVASIITSEGNSVVKKYTTLSNAIAAASENDTITLLADIESNGGTLEINKNLTLDLAGKTITAHSSANLFNVTGENVIFTLKDSDGNGKIISESDTADNKIITVAENATFVMNSGTLENTSSKVKSSVISSTGTVENLSNGATLTIGEANTQFQPTITVNATNNSVNMAAAINGDSSFKRQYHD